MISNMTVQHSPVQVTHVAQSHARTGAFAQRLEPIIMNVTALELGSMDKTAQNVSFNDTYLKIACVWMRVCSVTYCLT